MKKTIQLFIAVFCLFAGAATAQPSDNIRQLTLNFILGEKGKVFAYQGEIKKNIIKLPQAIDISDSTAIKEIVQEARINAKKNGLTFFVAIKPSNKTDYKSVVDMLDYINRLNIKLFSQMEMTQNEQNAFGLQSGFGANGEMQLKDENDAAAEVNMLDLKGFILLFEVKSENEVTYNSGAKISNAASLPLSPFTIENITKVIREARNAGQKAGLPLKVVIYGKKTLKNKNVKILTTTLKSNSIYKFDIIGEDNEEQ